MLISISPDKNIHLLSRQEAKVSESDLKSGALMEHIKRGNIVVRQEQKKVEKDPPEKKLKKEIKPKNSK